MEIIVEKGIPIPKRRYSKSKKRPYTKWDLSLLTIGDSFAVSAKDAERAVQAAHKYKVKHYGFNYTVRKLSGNKSRIWRIK